MTSEARKSQMPILPLVRPVSRRTATVYGISIFLPGGLRPAGPPYTLARCAHSLLRATRFSYSRLVLRQEVLGRSGNAVLVGPPVRFRGHEEIAVRGRRGSGPLDRRG